MELANLFVGREQHGITDGGDKSVRKGATNTVGRMQQIC